MQEIKKFWESRTFWINTLAIIGGIVTLVQQELVLGATLTISGVINIMLRVITKSAIDK